MKSRAHFTILLLFLTALPASAQLIPIGGGDDTRTRETTLLDKGWTFHRGNVKGDPSLAEFDAVQWEEVTIPHDWAIKGPFDRSNDLQDVAIEQNFENTASEKTGRTGGLPFTGTGWYRRYFDIDLTQNEVPGGRRIFFQFDGAMSEARVFVNGREVGFWPYGYNSWVCEATDAINDDGLENIIAVRLENQPESSRWYPGAGLYRNVYLVETNRVHVPYGGQYVTTVCRGDRAGVSIRTEICGVRREELKVASSIVDRSTGKDIAHTSAFEVLSRTAGENGDTTVTVLQHLTVDDPELWSPETPSLYEVNTDISVWFRPKGPTHGRFSSAPPKVMHSDRISTVFGIRTLEFRPVDGFYLNGVKRSFRGVCLHHDLGPLGAAINRSAIRHQLAMLKDMGCDAIRTTHNMPAPELIELCDEMGLMAIVENFDEWDDPKCANGYHRWFARWAEKDMVNMLRRYRNNPSVVMWSIGNEVPSQNEPGGVETAAFLRDICHREDPGRPVTCGMDQVDAVLANGFAAVPDIPGFNYRDFKYAEGYRVLPQKLLLGSETASTVSSRGVYKFPMEKRADARYDDHQCSSYDLECASWSNIPDDDFVLQDDLPYTIGQFVWTGFDYLGEPFPYDTDGWPSHSSLFGIIDLASIPKDRFYLYRSIWNKEESTLHILPHWTWPGREGEVTPVMVYTSFDRAELFLNGRSLGIREKAAPMESDVTDVIGRTGSLRHLNRYRLIWDDVRYEPGTLTVKALDARGEVLATESVSTAGKARNISLEVSRYGVDYIAGGNNLFYVTVSVTDARGELCPWYDGLLEFEVSGAGTFRACANGDPTSLELFHIPRMHASGGKLTVILQSSGSPGEMTLKVSGKKLNSNTISITTK